MDKRHILNSVQLGMGSLPVVFSAIAVIVRKPLFSIPVVMIIAAVACFLPIFRQRANLWAFVFAAIASIPVNIYLLFLIADYDLLFFDSVIMKILIGFLFYCVVFSVEQIVVGIIVRTIRLMAQKRIQRMCNE